MKENKNKSYVLYIKGVEAFEKYKIPNVELMETKKFTDKQLANIAKGDMFLLSRQYNQKLWKMLKKIYAKQFKIVSIWIDSSIANLSFELFDKKQNLHTFKFHTEDSVLDFKVFKTKKEIGRGSGTPFFFVDSFTGPGSYSGRNIMRSSQFENIFNAAREFGNRYAEANGDCSGLLNPEVGKKDSYNGCLKDRPGRVKYVENNKEEPIVDVNYNKNETGDIEKQALVDEDEYLKVINFINNNVPAERLSNNIIFYRYDIVVPKDFKERITSLLDSPDYKNKFKFISDPHQCLIGILYLTTSDIDIAHHHLGKLTFEQLLELFTILADVSLDAPVELGELNANSQAQDRTKRARPTNMKVEVYPTTTSAEEGEVNPLTNDEVIEKIKRDLTEPAIEPNIYDLLKDATWTMAVLKDGKIIYVYDNCCFIGADKEKIIKKHAAMEIGAGYEKEEFVKVDKKIDMDRFNFFRKCPSVDGKNISEVYMSKEFLNDEVIIVLAKTKREKDNNKAELMFARRGDAEYNKRFEDGSKYAVLSSSLDNELYYAIKKRIANFVDSAKRVDYINDNVPNLLFAYLKTYGEFDNIHYIYVDTSVHYKIKNDELDSAQCLTDAELDSLETTQIELDGYKKLTSKDYIMVTPEDDIFKCPEIPRFKNEFTGIGIITAVEDNLDVKEEENDELVFIICPKGEASYDIICKTKKELDSDENLNNYRAKFINPQTQLFNLIKNDLLNVKHSLNLMTREQINSVTKIYVPSHTIGLHYKITEDLSNNFTVEILFSYSQTSYDEFDNLEALRSKRRYQGFYDFENK